MMFRSVLISALAIGSLLPASGVSQIQARTESAVYRPGTEGRAKVVTAAHRRRRVVRRHTKRNSAVRIGGGAAAGAAIGALAGGGKGAAIGAIAGGGAGTVYDQHERHKGR